MIRFAEKAFSEWKNRKNRKPLVLLGARQVGKSWLMQEFGRKNFATVHEFSFQGNEDLASIFNHSKRPVDLLPKLSAFSGRKIDIENDVLIFDEIQDCNAALNSLKYFNEECPRMAIMSAGSLLGVKLKKSRLGTGDGGQWQSYPVGKVELLDVEPLSFAEFLLAKDPGLYEFYEGISGTEPIEDVFHHRLLDAYDVYLFTGGMPEVVSEYLRNGDPVQVEKLQRDLLVMYEDDIVKYNGEIDAGKILLVLRSVVPQLAKDNEKFLYGVVREGARARGYEEAIEWLVSARIVRRVQNLSEMKYPLSAYEIRNAFKLYHLDVGLLRELAGIAQKSLVTDADFDFKGPFVENYVLQQLCSTGCRTPRYFAERADREIDFVIQIDDQVCPIEVKSGTDRKAATFKTYVNEKRPRYAIRFSRRNLKRDGAFVNIPVYLAAKFMDCL